MQEIRIQSNKTGLMLLVDETPNVRLLHDDDFNVWASALDLTLSEHIQNYYKYKSRDRPKSKEGILGRSGEQRALRVHPQLQ